MQQTVATQPDLRGLFWAGVAGIGASALYWWHLRRSRAEREDPYGVRTLVADVERFLDGVELDHPDAGESAFHAALLEKARAFFRGVEVESNCLTEWGRPDILINDRVALELKYKPNKAGADRCAGQVGRFAQEWYTYVLVLDADPDGVQALEDTLRFSGLKHVPVVSFS